MQAEMYEITPCPQGRLATMPRPRGGEWLKSELASLKNRGVTDLVSMLTPEEEAELVLQAEAQLCEELGMRFHRCLIRDRGVPAQPEFDNFISLLVPVLEQQGFIAIHCRAGIGRSSVVAAGFLCRLGLSADEAVDLISQARGIDVPDTDEQLDFIYSLEQHGPTAL
jgi:protein-tyrosine phosphatase